MFNAPSFGTNVIQSLVSDDDVKKGEDACCFNEFSLTDFLYVRFKS